MLKQGKPTPAEHGPTSIYTCYFEARGTYCSWTLPYFYIYMLCWSKGNLLQLNTALLLYTCYVEARGTYSSWTRPYFYIHVMLKQGEPTPAEHGPTSIYMLCWSKGNLLQLNTALLLYTCYVEARGTYSSWTRPYFYIHVMLKQGEPTAAEHGPTSIYMLCWSKGNLLQLNTALLLYTCYVEARGTYSSWTRPYFYIHVMLKQGEPTPAEHCPTSLYILCWSKGNLLQLNTALLLYTCYVEARGTYSSWTRPYFYTCYFEARGTYCSWTRPYFYVHVMLKQGEPTPVEHDPTSLYMLCWSKGNLLQLNTALLLYTCYVEARGTYSSWTRPYFYIHVMLKQEEPTPVEHDPTSLYMLCWSKGNLLQLNTALLLYTCYVEARGTYSSWTRPYFSIHVMLKQGEPTPAEHGPTSIYMLCWSKRNLLQLNTALLLYMLCWSKGNLLQLNTALLLCTCYVEARGTYSSWTRPYFYTCYVEARGTYCSWTRPYFYVHVMLKQGEPTPVEHGPTSIYMLCWSKGNLLQLNTALLRNEDFFVKCGIYLILEKLKIITYRNLFKKVWVSQLRFGVNVCMRCFNQATVAEGNRLVWQFVYTSTFPKIHGLQ